MSPRETLLDPDEPLPVIVAQPNGTSPLLLCCDHAGNRIPRALGTLGLPPHELERHIAIDIGALAVATGIAQALDATLIAQPYSRLVIDCNRQPGRPTSIPEISETTEIPGNLHLSEEERAQRAREILHPYHHRIETEIDLRVYARRPVLIATIHSFTPVFKGVSRPWHLGTIHGLDGRGARAFLDLAAAETDLVVGENEPYIVEMDDDYTLPIHAEGRGIPYVELEIRQDLIGTEVGQQAMADRLSRLLGRWVDHMLPLAE
ncbi:MAG: N-formylglutamate amidohydrolase [Rhodospirillaceae bacterium]|nr:N-formylglutamate amidohydrolase [Rhodospirillaceae bacterium]